MAKKVRSSSRGITLAKINQLHRNSNWNYYSLLQNNNPSFNHIAAKMAKLKSGKLKNSTILSSSRGTTLVKTIQSHQNANWN
jgi:hypothetical protein